MCVVHHITHYTCCWERTCLVKSQNLKGIDLIIGNWLIGLCIDKKTHNAIFELSAILEILINADKHEMTSCASYFKKISEALNHRIDRRQWKIQNLPQCNTPKERTKEVLQEEWNSSRGPNTEHVPRKQQIRGQERNNSILDWVREWYFWF